MSEDQRPSAAVPPATGSQLLDAALAEIAGLDAAGLVEQHDRMQAAHETMMALLDSSRDAGQAPIPGVL